VLAVRTTTTNEGRLFWTVGGRAARLLYPKYGRFFFNFCASQTDVCSCAYYSHNIQQEIRAVARKPRDAAGVLGLKFADIIYYRPKVTIFALPESL